MGTWKGSAITESSWLIMSHKWAADRIAYTGNDEDGVIFIVDLKTGQVLGTIGVNHALVDPESGDIDPAGILWLGDLGDNAGPGDSAIRDNIVLYAHAEPASRSNSDTKVWRRYPCQYPNGTAHNAETLIIWPNGKKQIVSKVAKGVVYDVPKTLSQSSMNHLTTAHSADSRLDFVSDAVAQIDGRFAFVIRKGHESTISVFSYKWGFVKNFTMPTMVKPEGIAIERDGKHLWVCDDNGAAGGHYQRVAIPAAYQPKKAAPKPTPTPTPTPTPAQPLPALSPCQG